MWLPVQIKIMVSGSTNASSAHSSNMAQAWEWGWRRPGHEAEEGLEMTWEWGWRRSEEGLGMRLKKTWAWGWRMRLALQRAPIKEAATGFAAELLIERRGLADWDGGRPKLGSLIHSSRPKNITFHSNDNQKTVPFYILCFFYCIVHNIPTKECNCNSYNS